MYKIADFIFEIVGIHERYIPENFKKFKYEGIPSYHYDIHITNEIPLTHQHFIVNKEAIKIHIQDNLETRYLYFQGETQAYAKCEETDATHTLIYLHQDYLKYIYIDTIFTSLFSLERRMYKHNHYILHSSYIVYHHQAILFTAPSGTGKSTQASLWEKYRGVQVINGDRTLITQQDHHYYANGWPVCGSSEICHNQTYPLVAIVMLDQGQVNKIEDLPYLEKTKRLLKEITINYHNQDYFDKSFNFINQLITDVPITHLSCTISEEAVDCLDDYLKGGENNESV